MPSSACKKKVTLQHESRDVRLFYLSRHGDHLTLHSFPNDALPISAVLPGESERHAGRDRQARCPCRGHRDDRHAYRGGGAPPRAEPRQAAPSLSIPDRKSTRLNSSHSQISYAVFCLQKKSNPTARVTRRSSLLLVTSRRPPNSPLFP